MTESTAKTATRQVTKSQAVDRLARIGFALDGVIHLLIGLIALQVAWGDGGKADESGAFAAMAQHGLGRALLWVGALGFLAVAIWSLGNAIVGSRNPDGSRRIGEMIKDVGRAVVFVALAFLAFRFAAGAGESGGKDHAESATATLFSLPGGVLLVAALGLGFIGVGLYSIYKGVAQKFLDDLQGDASTGAGGSAVKVLGSVGYPARGVALAIIGTLFIVAAIQHDPDDAGGLDQALKSLLDQPFGPWLLSAVALGIASYGLYCFARAWYQRI